ncbi:MAG: NAD(P)-dependent oxidoreductase [Bacillota bacterium]|nr:NAD(P)-dependent oxidoreductase [Bacillota bacterium]
MDKKIGFIGLGRMGGPMAMNLVKAGYTLCVYDVFQDAMQPFADQGVETANSIKELAMACGVIITIVPADEQILSIYTGEDGIVKNAGKGTLCIEMTSAMGRTVKKVAQYAQEQQADLLFVDAPVSGGVDGATAGTLTIMIGGEKEAIDQATPYLNVLGGKLLYSGKLGDGKSVKMINQMLNALNTAAAAEAIYLARKLGIDTDILINIVNNSSGGSWVMQNNVPKFMLTGQYDKGFKLGLMTKDLRLSLAEADVNQLDLPLASQALQAYEGTISRLSSDVNYNAVYEWIKSHNEGKEQKS